MLPFDTKTKDDVDISGFKSKCSIGDENLSTIEELYVYFDNPIKLPVGRYHKTFEKKWISMPFHRKILK